ncbi:MAG: hypothetical protein K9M84_10505 [Spirochaetia bacterium]|nr:hypothetical protein [Spirochaetia bacterium]
MRTTVTLRPEIASMVKEHKSFKELVNTALYQFLSGYHDPEEPPFIVQPKAMGLNSGIDISEFNKLVDDLDSDAFLEVADLSNASYKANTAGDHDNP